LRFRQQGSARPKGLGFDDDKLESAKDYAHMTIKFNSTMKMTSEAA
jgi:hypothetical protein